MKNMQTCILNMASVVELVGLLWWNTSTSQNIWEHTQSPEGEWVLPMSERILWTMTMWGRCSASSAVKPKYKHMQNFQDDWCTTDKSMQNSAPWWYLSVSPPLTWRWFCEWLQQWLHNLCDILFTDMAQIIQGGITNTGNSLLGTRIPHKTAVRHSQH